MNCVYFGVIVLYADEWYKARYSKGRLSLYYSLTNSTTVERVIDKNEATALFEIRYKAVYEGLETSIDCMCDSNFKISFEVGYIGFPNLEYEDFFVGYGRKNVVFEECSKVYVELRYPTEFEYDKELTYPPFANGTIESGEHGGLKIMLNSFEELKEAIIFE